MLMSNKAFWLFSFLFAAHQVSDYYGELKVFHFRAI